LSDTARHDKVHFFGRSMAHHALTLSPEAHDHVATGLRDMPVGAVAGAERCEPGQPVRLMSPAGELAALAIADPENALLRVMATAEEGYSSIDARFLRARVKRAVALRAQFGLVRQRTSHRLLNGAGDGLPGFGADVYADHAVLYAYSRGLLSPARLLAELLMEELGLSGVVLKLRGREAAQSSIKQEIVGTSPAERIIVHEEGVPFEVHLLGGLNVGLFTDMREHRSFLQRFVGGKRVLNVFSYTGSLSVAAARAGASAVTSVDLAAGVQRWARANFELSQLDPSLYHFETQEVMAFFKKAGREGQRFDVIIVDPPTYSAARAGAWSMRKDYPELISRAIALLPSGGLLWLSANARDLPPLPLLARDAFARAKRSGQVLSMGGLPPDYPTLPAQPEDRYLQVSLFSVS
jgi:23S rRNA (cytosine1962-C5)-methyltransferase